jgi:LysM repeat protein
VRLRQVKAPPVWVIGQVAVLLALLIAVVPQIINRPSSTGCAWYTVQSGDTLSELSGLFGVSAKAIATTNRISSNNNLQVNQQLCIPAPPGEPLLTRVGLVNVSVSALAPSQVLHAPTNVRRFVAFALPFARETSKQTGWPVSMLLGQWGLEKSWRAYTFTGYNWGNCGAMPGFPAIPGTSVPGSPNKFAFANTPEQGVAEYVHVAHLSYYRAIAPAWRSGGANAATRALGSSPWDWGHYTAIGSPGSSIIGLMQAYNLYWYDTH